MSAVNFQCLSEAPASPESGRVKLYADSSCNLYLIDGAGNVTSIGELGGSETIDADYTIQPTDYSLRVTGARTITVPDALPREVTIYAATDTVTLENEAASALVIENFILSTIAVGETRTIIWDESLAGYYAK